MKGAFTILALSTTGAHAFVPAPASLSMARGRGLPLSARRPLDFAFPSYGLTEQRPRTREQCSRSLSMSLGGDDSRRGFLSQAAATLGGILVATSVSTSTVMPAQAASLSKANAVLAENGLPPILGVPDGFTPLVEFYGRTSGVKKTREPYLVQFCHPSGWIVSRPNVDKNGEEGTVSAGDYQKGDSASFYVGEAVDGKVEDQGNAFFSEVVAKAISQKSDNIYEDFKVLKKTTGPKGPNGAQYFIVEFKYTLNTGAGFLVDRKGVASITQVGKNVQALVTATTATRWKKIGDDLKAVAESFRVYDKVAV